MKPSGYLFIISIICSLLSGCWLIDDSPLEGDVKDPQFASGSAHGNYYPFARGVIDAAGETLGIFLKNTETEGSLENATKIVSGDSYMGDAYMALMQEDVFEYARRTNIENYDNGRPIDKSLLKIASQIQVLLALYREDVHLLVRTGLGIEGVSDLTGMTVNIGSLNSGTYVTASTIMKAHGISYTAKTDPDITGFEKVRDGEYHAAFYVTGAPSSAIKERIPSNADVKLIPVQMPESQKSYDENGTIKASSYGFQDSDVGNNIAVKTLLVAGPNFDDRNLGILFDYIFSHAEQYKSFNHKWEDVSLVLSQDYMRANPEKCNYRAMCYVSGFPELDPFYVEPLFCSAEGDSSYHDMAVELIWLMSHNMDVDLRERNTTGSWENAYYMMNGDSTMAIVQDDIFPYLVGSDDMYDSMMAASMRKVVPLHYEYVHLLVNNNQYGAEQAWRSWYIEDTWGGANVRGYPLNLTEVFSDPANLNDAEPVLHINVGPKTSGTFITAMEILKSYKSYDSDDGDEDPDMEQMEIHYHFDNPSDAVKDVSSGNYHLSFLVSGVPYHRFYSHDTWDITTELPDCSFIPADFYGTSPEYYNSGTLAGGGDLVFENYPYPWDTTDETILQNDITTIRLRAVQVVSPVFDHDLIELYLKSVFRKSYYMTYSSDPADLDFMPDPLWIAIKKESFSIADADYETYSEEIIGAKEYFLRNPFGWHKSAVRYYLSLF